MLMEIAILVFINNTIRNLVHISLPNETAQVIKYHIPITNEINIGECEIQFYAIYENNLKSDIEGINAKFEIYIYISEDPHIYSFTNRRNH